MRKIREIHDFKKIKAGDQEKYLADPERTLFLDIETTGLSKETSLLYLIGFGYFSEKGFITLQLFADSPEDEKTLLTEAANIAGGFDTLLYFNGRRFDLPFLSYKFKKYGLRDPFSDFSEFDIYLEIRPFKKLLGIENLKQRSIEDFLGRKSDDPYTGRELIAVYHDYVREKSPELLSPLLYHNREDLLGLLRILPILDYRNIPDILPGYRKMSVNEYPSLNGSKKKELIIEFDHDLILPTGFTAINEYFFLLKKGSLLSVRFPVVCLTLKHFYENYRDYYYLPAEDCCILKDAAGGVDKAFRKNASRNNCYTKKEGAFIRIPGSFISDPGPSLSFTLFKKDIKDKDIYICIDELMAKEKEALDRFGLVLLKTLIN